MRIGIDCQGIFDVKTGRGAGIGRYIFYLTCALLRQKISETKFVLFFDKKASRETIDELKKCGEFDAIFIGDKIPFFSRHVYFPWIIKNSRVDFVIFPANAMPFFCFQRSMVVIHDLAIYLHPEWFPRQFFATKILVPFSLIKAQKIVAVSNNTKNDILKIFPNVADDKVEVVYPGICLPIKIAPSVAPAEKYIVFVGTLEPRKNIINLLRAFIKYVDETDDDIKLKLVGAWGWKTDEIRRELRTAQEKYPTKIELLESLDDEVKTKIIAGSKALLLPSFYEGFGLPIIEAMQLGAPVVCGNNSSMKEIAGNAAILVDVENVTELKEAIKKILSDKLFVEELVRRGKEVVKQFDWDNAAKEILQINI
ncbi:glycosyltransferase family 4 protein [Candidatus Falkowbacteria bacterium]|nr:glycosyltransferase family 4 protein [Candidatus Falkowbacteria bacterium]